MPKIKSHKTVEQIAKKHRMDVSDIQKQLDMGEPIEHEHTRDHELAMDIALQHLDEIPDYYTRLKKMEASAKKEHSKFKDVKEHCGCEEDAVKELEIQLKKIDDTSYDSIDKLMRRIMKKHNITAKQLHNAFVSKNDKTPDDWIKDLKEGTLHQWFKGSSGVTKSGKRKPGWVQSDGSPCANEPGETKTPKCFSSSKLASMSKSEVRSAVKRKSAADPDQQSKTGAAKPTYVSTDKPKKTKMNEESDNKGKGSGKKDACYSKVKARFKVWPSAYASGALVKCRQVGAANWGTKSEEIMNEEQRYCPLCDKKETRSECSYGGKAWDKVSIKDHEYSMARSELKTITSAVKRLQAKVSKGEGDLEAWVQSKITKAADYIDTAADYVNSGEMDEAVNPLKDPKTQIKKSSGASALTPDAAAQLGPKAQKLQKQASKKVDIPRFEEKLVDKIKGEIVIEKCWTGYTRKKNTAKFAKGSCVKKEDVTIEDANGNPYIEFIDLIKPDPMVSPKSTFMANNSIDEATRLQSQTGNIIAVTILWRGKYYAMRMFFPQVKLPSRQEVTIEIQKVYPGARVVHHSVSEFIPGQPLIQAGFQGGSAAKLGPNKNYVKPMGEEVEIEESKKSEMPCNKPKAEAHGSGETGKSHVVKACKDGKEKLIRFGQLGVKGSPKKEGESKEYASRRHRFQTRHAKNIAKGNMSAAYWANKVKW